MINNFIHLLKTSGIKDVCISPGLRNTIISLGFIKNGFNCHSILDERSSAYFALGMALKTKRPSVLICTSGTATANYLPAIIEASQSKVPIIIITADRPRQLLNTGENQTINQKSIYGDFVRSSLSFDNREDVIDKINDSLKFININNSKITIGPIHFNIHLDDFEKENENIMNKQIPNTISNVINTYNFNWDSIPFEDTFNIHNYQKPLIILGRLSQKLDSKLIFKLSKHLKAPILTDPLSQLRFSDVDSLNLYEHYIDQSHIQPDLIIRIGQKPVSKKLNKKITKLENDGIEHLNFSSLLIDESGQFNDNASTILKVHYKEFIHFILNNGPYSAHYDQNFDYELPNGNNVVLAFLSRSYHESVKNSDAYVLTQIGDSNKINLESEFLFYSRPKGTYEGLDTEKLLLDFYLVNTKLSATGNKVKLTIKQG
mgnify:CR=1 FL=1